MVWNSIVLLFSCMVACATAVYPYTDYYLSYDPSEGDVGTSLTFPLDDSDCLNFSISRDHIALLQNFVTNITMTNNRTYVSFTDIEMIDGGGYTLHCDGSGKDYYINLVMMKDGLCYESLISTSITGEIYNITCSVSLDMEYDEWIVNGKSIKSTSDRFEIISTKNYTIEEFGRSVRELLIKIKNYDNTTDRFKLESNVFGYKYYSAPCFAYATPPQVSRESAVFESERYSRGMKLFKMFSNCTYFIDVSHDTNDTLRIEYIGNDTMIDQKNGCTISLPRLLESIV